MQKNKIVVVIIFVILTLALLLIYNKFFKKNNSFSEKLDVIEENIYSSNTIKDVSYISKDLKGNEYIINAVTGEIDISNSDIIYLTNVKSIIKLNNSNNIEITSNFGKYNTKNFDTIFSENVIITYLENKITSEYLDFSMERNSMLVSRNVIYTNIDNILKADVLEMNITTKDTKIYMYEDKKKVNVKSRN